MNWTDLGHCRVYAALGKSVGSIRIGNEDYGPPG
jgi:hypothetical protein